MENLLKSAWQYNSQETAENESVLGGMINIAVATNRDHKHYRKAQIVELVKDAVAEWEKRYMGDYEEVMPDVDNSFEGWRSQSDKPVTKPFIHPEQFVH